jgi:dienelactone hydrolase
VLRILAQWLDRCAIKAATKTVREGFATPRNACAGELLNNPDFFRNLTSEAPNPVFSSAHDFHFGSQAPVGPKANDIVHGKYFPARRNRPGEGTGPTGEERKGAVLLVHGWNAEMQYRVGFPRMAGRLNKLGLGTAMIELPFHSQRTPTEPDVPRNFICDDLLLMLNATRQCLQDLHSTALWLKKEGYGQVFIWGFSLGAWLAGLLVCFTQAVDGAVLVTPVARMDRAIQELAFCGPIRSALRTHPLDVTALNLTANYPLIPRENILIVQSGHDLFVGGESVNELWEKWGKPERWKVKHGHISILGSTKELARMGRWVEARVAVRQPCDRV